MQWNLIKCIPIKSDFWSHPQTGFKWSGVGTWHLFFKSSSGDSQLQSALRTIALEYLLYLQFLSYSWYIDPNFQHFAEHLSLNAPQYYIFSIVQIKLMFPILWTSSSILIEILFSHSQKLETWKSSLKISIALPPPFTYLLCPIYFIATNFKSILLQPSNAPFKDLNAITS